MCLHFALCAAPELGTADAGQKHLSVLFLRPLSSGLTPAQARPAPSTPHPGHLGLRRDRSRSATHSRAAAARVALLVPIYETSAGSGITGKLEVARATQRSHAAAMQYGQHQQRVGPWWSALGCLGLHGNVHGPSGARALDTCAVASPPDLAPQPGRQRQQLPSPARLASADHLHVRLKAGNAWAVARRCWRRSESVVPRAGKASLTGRCAEASEQWRNTNENPPKEAGSRLTLGEKLCAAVKAGQRLYFFINHAQSCMIRRVVTLACHQQMAALGFKHFQTFVCFPVCP